MCAGLFLAQARPAQAQDRSLRDILSFLVTNQAVPTADVVKDVEAAEATRDTIARALLLELAALPLATSPSAFTYRFNPALGTIERRAHSFGPFFVDRAVTAGRRQVSVGLAYRYARFTQLDGRSLRDGTLVTTANRFLDEPRAFDVEALTLNAASSTVTVFTNIGVTDWLDVGAAVPFVRFDMSGERVNTYRGSAVVQARAVGTSTGLADVAIRAKARLTGEGVSGLSGAFELRLPTGDPDNLSGAGRAGFKAALLGSVGRGPVDVHVNGAIAGGGISREIDISGAVAIAATPRLTLSAESLIRRVDELGGIADIAARHPLIVGVDTIRLLPVGGNATAVAGVAGVRWNPAETWLVNAYVMWAANDRGLTASPIPAISIDYSFAR